MLTWEAYFLFKAFLQSVGISLCVLNIGNQVLKSFNLEDLLYRLKKTQTIIFSLLCCFFPSSLLLFPVFKIWGELGYMELTGKYTGVCISLNSIKICYFKELAL